MGVNVYLGRTVVEVKKDGVRCEYGGSVTLYSAGTIIWVAGIESSRLTQNAAGALAGAGRGRLTTDKYLRSTKDESVYVTGDNIFYIPEGEKAPVPQMVENCEQSAHTAAHNICCSITGEGELEQYRPKFHGVMVSVGGRYGAARVGTAGHMVNLPSFFAMQAKHFINIVYFAQVLGWNKIFSYLKHEFFTIRNRRSFLGGHSPTERELSAGTAAGLAWSRVGLRRRDENRRGLAEIGAAQRFFRFGRELVFLNTERSRCIGRRDRRSAERRRRCHRSGCFGCGQGFNQPERPRYIQDHFRERKTGLAGNVRLRV